MMPILPLAVAMILSNLGVLLIPTVRFSSLLLPSCLSALVTAVSLSPITWMIAVVFVSTIYLGLRGVGDSTWFVPGLTAACGGARLYSGMKRHTREQLWFGVYLLGFGILLYWLPGGPHLQLSWLAMGMGGSFAIVGFSRLIRFHAT